MTDQYKPSVTTAYIPEDGGWTSFNETNVLLLSIPQFEQFVKVENKGYSYVWLYDQDADGYIFCFKLNSGEEQAVHFPNKQAGKLLQGEEVLDVFQIALTAKPLESVDDDTLILWLPSVQFNPRP